MTGTAHLRERRAAQRFVLLLRAAKLITPGSEFLCILRDVSANGAKLRLFHPLPQRDSLCLELAGGRQLHIEYAWEKGDDIGFRFAEGPIDPEPLIAEVGQFPKRGIRLRLGAPALIHARDGVRPGQLRDISLSGARFDCDWIYAIDELIRIEAHPFPPIHAKVRWRNGRAHGIRFEREFAMDELARLIAMHQDEGRAKSDAIPLRR